jgi:hypothetical protein
MNEKNFINVFVTEFPEFQSYLEEHLEYNQELLPHIFFGDFNEHLIELLQEEKDDTNLSSIFAFFERMATNGDIYVQEVLSVTILERIGDNPKILKVAHKYMGPNTRKASNEIEKDWGRRLT